METAMTQKSYLISDLHLGDTSVRDNFAYKEKREQFSRFLDTVGDSELLVLGDMFEFWQANIDRAVLANQSLLDRLADMNVSYIPGNHDEDLAGFARASGSLEDFLNHAFFRERAKKELSRKYGGKRFVFRHGHEGDVYNDKTSPDFGRVVTILTGMFEDKLGSRYIDKHTQTRPLEETLITVADCLQAILDRFMKLLAIKETWKSRARGIDAAAVEGDGALCEELLRIDAMAVPASEKDRLAEECIRSNFDAVLAQVLAEQAGSDTVAPRVRATGGALDRGLFDSGRRWGPRWKFIPDHLRNMKRIWQAQGDPDNTILVVGHTHIPGLCGQWYKNSGSWSDLRHDVLTINHEDGTVAFHQWENGALRVDGKPEIFDDPS